LRDGLVAELCITNVDAAVAAELHRVGRAYRLILCDFPANRVVDLADRGAIDDMFQEE
jgi:hypothetical protein